MYLSSKRQCGARTQRVACSLHCVIIIIIVRIKISENFHYLLWSIGEATRHSDAHCSSNSQRCRDWSGEAHRNCYTGGYHTRPESFAWRRSLARGARSVLPAAFNIWHALALGVEVDKGYNVCQDAQSACIGFCVKFGFATVVINAAVWGVVVVLDDVIAFLLLAIRDHHVAKHT